jgi:NADPH2 dehydrogenase
LIGKKLMSYPRISSFKTPGELSAYLTKAGIDLQLDERLHVGADAPLAQPYRLASGFTIGNRFCVLPMEGWDGTTDGHPSELTFRRWRRFGMSGA